MTPDRMREIQKELDLWLVRKSATKKQLQSLLGKLQFIGKCVRPARVFVARL